MMEINEAQFTGERLHWEASPSRDSTKQVPADVLEVWLQQQQQQQQPRQHAADT